MNTKSIKEIIVLVSLFLCLDAFSCNVTPVFTYSATHTCGLPVIVKATNTTGGSYAATSKYWWKVNYQTETDTVTGLDSAILLLKQVGTNTVKLFSRDTSGCIDSSSAANINVSTNSKSILDQSGINNHAPSWINCIQYITDPDTFSIRFSSSDTLKNLRVLWGDGSSDSGGGNLLPNTVKSHLYNNLGIFTVKIITQNGACIDTVYGKVTSQRQPTAGIIGPPSGSNRGCVPHRLRIVNNSYNISNNTTFEIDWGVGPVLNLPYTSYKDTLYNTYRIGMCGGVIKITARNTCGNSVSTWNPVDISDADDALWTVITTCDPTKPHVFYNISTDNYCLQPDFKEYFWDFGDGTTVGWTTSKAPQSHIFKTEGDYVITLIAKNSCGYDTFKSTVPVYYTPFAGYKYTANRGCLPLQVTLTDTSRGRGYTRLWTITENGTTSTFTDSILNYTFTKPGVQTVALTVSNRCGTASLSRNFTITAPPDARFSNITGSCVPVTVTFNNTSTSYFSNPVFLWDFGDSTFSTQKNPPPKIYTLPGNYTVRLIVGDSCGADTFAQAFTVYDLPEARLGGDTVGCTFDSLSFVNQSLNAGTFEWSFGDGQYLRNSQTGVTKHSYNTPGTYTVQLIALTAAGCSDTTTHNLVIKPGAKALFDINKTYACNPATFKFTNNSIYGKDFSWYANDKLIASMHDLPDSTLMTDTTVVRLKLKVTSNSSCQDDSIEKIYFTPKNPVADIPDSVSGCGPLTVNFINNSTYFTSLLWKFGNGATSNLKNPTYVYPPATGKDTLYYPELRVSNWAGCKDSSRSKVRVFPVPTAMFTLDQSKGCGPLAVKFSNASITNNSDPDSTMTYKWNFGGSISNAANPTHIFQAAKIRDTFYTVSLISTTLNGCLDTFISRVQVYPLPFISFSADKMDGCAMLPVHFTNHSKPNDTGSIAIMSFKWNSGNGINGSTRDFNSVYGASLYSDTVYKVKLTGYSEHGCADSTTLDITVHPKPDAVFQLNKLSGCTPLLIATNNLSISKDGGALTHWWKFGSTYSSRDENDSVVFYNTTNSDVSYKIWYEATSQYGCKDTTQQDIVVRPKPQAKFNLSTKKGCAPLNLKVTDASVNAFTYFWGEGNGLDTGNLTENIILPGLKLSDTTYTILHQVMSQYGCLSDTISQDVYVYGRPSADFGYSMDSFCSNHSVSIINNTLGGFRFQWRFGDNTSSTAINPKHKYILDPSTGKDSVFTVFLEASSFTGCKDTAIKPITVINKPLDKITLDKTAGCTDLTINMSQHSKSFRTLYWDFGDLSATETGDTVVHTFINTLNNITMQSKISLYRQKFNCLDTVSTVVNIYPKPVAGFKVGRNNPCDAGFFQFVNQSKYNNTNAWKLENGGPYNGINFSAQLTPSIYSDTNYRVQLFVKNTYQCADSIIQLVKVKQKQLIKFTNSPLVACENAYIDFTNHSSGSIRYFWKFGDGGMSNDDHPSYLYSLYGTYKVMLYGYDRDGCVDSSDGSTFVNILERPKADFTYLPATPKLPNAQVNFVATPVVNSVSLNDLTYDWNFGDNSYPTKNISDRNPTHIYTVSGTIAVKLVVANMQCSDYIIKPIFIEDPKPVVDFTPDTVRGCVPLKVKFKNRSQNVVTYRWIFGDGSSESSEMEPTHIFEIPGIWDVTLVATGTGGVTTKTFKYLIHAYPKPVVDFYTGRRALNLPNAVFYMKNLSTDITRSEWTVYDSIGFPAMSSSQYEPSFNVVGEGRYRVQLIGTNTEGCSDTMDKPEYLSVQGKSYVFVPTAFTPNKNGKNDEFKPSLFNIRPENYVFRVFNRWGEKVFETTDREEAWDGTFNGTLCEQETYVWSLYGEHENGDLFTLRGTVTLLR